MDVSPLTCTATELYTVVSGSNPKNLRLSLSNPAIQEDHLLALLRNARITQDIVELICEHNDWISSYRLQAAIVNCAKTPYTIAMRLIQLLFWHDLLKTASNLKLGPRIRRAAENYLKARISEMSLGEKMTLARTCPRPLIGHLRGENELKVIAELLRNPQLVEDDIVLMINDERTARSVLLTIGRDFKWSVRYPIRLALVRNVRTPLHLALSILSKLKKQDLEPISKAPQTPELIRRAAERILSGEY
jgi:hypothetical protein